MKVTKARVTKREYGSSVDYKVSVRNKPLGTYGTEEQAANWLEFMLSKGLAVHPFSDIKPSGVMPTEFALSRCEYDYDLVRGWIDNHPAIGRTPEQYRAECREQRALVRAAAAQAAEKEERLKAAGWDDLTEILKLFIGKDLNAPYSQFSEDLDKLRLRKEEVAENGCVRSATSVYFTT